MSLVTGKIGASNRCRRRYNRLAYVIAAAITFTTTIRIVRHGAAAFSPLTVIRIDTKLLDRNVSAIRTRKSTCQLCSVINERNVSCDRGVPCRRRSVEPLNRVSRGDLLSPIHQAPSLPKVQPSLSCCAVDGGKGPDGAESTILAWRSELREGALYVHRNFLDIFLPAYKRAVRAALGVCIGVGITYRASPALGCKFIKVLRMSLLSLDVVGLPVRLMASFLSSAMIMAASILLLVAVATAMLLPGVLRLLLQRLTDTFPGASNLGVLSNGVNGLCLRIGTVAAAFGAILRKTATEMQQGNHSGIILDSIFERPVSFPFLAFVVGPIGEEFICRKILQSSLERVFSEPLESELPQMPSKSYSSSPWAIVSSSTFAAAHSANWTGPLRGMQDGNFQPGNSEVLGTAIFLMAMALSHVAVSLFLSLRVYAPMYDRR